jgi:magnesium transporter
MEQSNQSEHSNLRHILFFHPNHRIERFLSLSIDEKINLLEHSPQSIKKELLNHLALPDIIAVLEKLDPDQATDFLQLLPRHKQTQVLEQLSETLKDTLSELLHFDPQTAAGLMTLDYIQVDIEDDIQSVAKKFRSHEQRTGRPPVILATKERKLAGVLPGYELGMNDPGDKIAKHVKRLPTVKHNASHDSVVDVFEAHPHSRLAVINEEGYVIGIIYSDDVLQLLHKQEGASLYDFAGISKEEAVTDVARRKVQRRYRWLIINVGTAFLAAFTISLFEETLSKFVLLAVYMPIVAGMGGNAGTQTLAVVVRGITLKQIDLHTAWGTIKNEVIASFINGIIIGLLVAVIVLVLNRNLQLAMVLALAMVVNLMVAAFFGTLVPLVMSKLGKDPATSASIFITMATDILGFITFLGLGSMILN